MKTMKTILFLCCIFVLLSGCGNRNKSNIIINDILLSNETDEDDGDRFYLIDLEQHVKNRFADEFTINSIAKDITFIPLETTDESLLRMSDFKIAKINERYYISSGSIYLFSGIMEFDTTGHYIKHLMLKNPGNGPNELPRFVYNWTYNNNTQLLVASSSYQIVLHSFERNTTNKYTLSSASWDECLLNDGTMASLLDATGLVAQGSPDIPYIHFRNQEGEIIRSIFYPEKRDIAYSNLDQTSLSSYKLLSHYSCDALFQDVFSDTIQRIRNMEDIKPYMVLYRGSLAPSPKDANNQARINQTITINAILDTKHFIFIRFKQRNETNISVWNKETLSFIANLKAVYNDENDIVLRGNGHRWNFTKYISPTGKEMLIPILSYQDGKLYSVIDAEQAMEFLPGLVEDDNPVLMIIDID